MEGKESNVADKEDNIVDKEVNNVDKYSQFKEHVEDIAGKFKAVDKNETIRLISHLDADGISASALLIKLFNKDNRKYSVSIVQQLNNDVIKELATENHNVYVFADLGSGQLSSIKELLDGKKVFILDHHKPEKIDEKDIFHLNPHLFDIDGSREISGAGVVYFFTKAINKEMEDYAHVAVIGAIGDIQEDQGFAKLNNEILQTAIEKNKIKVEKGLRMFGAQTKPLHKVLEYSMDPYIPGVSGTESGAIQFLNQIGIKPMGENGWKKVVNLSKEEMDKLITSIVMKREGEHEPENVLGNIYSLLGEENESPTRDVKEFSTLLNACGRMGKASLGIGACLGDKKIKQRAVRNLNGYRKEIVNAINWYYDNKDSKDIIKGNGFLIINTKDNIMPTIVGTMASILSKSNEIEDGTYILSMAQLDNKMSKASLRVVGRGEVDLREMIKEIIQRIDKAEAGGHSFAAGALIPTEKEKDFIESAKEVLRKKALEEDIL